MKLNRVLFVIILVFNLFANDEINVNFKDLRIVDLIKITSKIINKNILITQDIEGTVDFIPNKPLHLYTQEEKQNLLDLLLKLK